MAWFRGDDKSHSHRKFLAVGLVGTGLFWRMVAWSCDHETDGRLPVEVIPALSPELSPRARSALLDKMASDAVWLLEPMADCDGVVTAYLLHDFLVYNPSHGTLEERREREKKRVAERRRNG